MWNFPAVSRVSPLRLETRWTAWPAMRRWMKSLARSAIANDAGAEAISRDVSDADGCFMGA